MNPEKSDSNIDEELLKLPNLFEEIYNFNEHLEKRRWIILIMFCLFR